MAASCLTAVLWGSGTAAACGNAVWHEVTQRKLPAHLKQAEQLLQDGKYYEVVAPRSVGERLRGADAGFAAGRKEKIICWQSSVAAA